MRDQVIHGALIIHALSRSRDRHVCSHCDEPMLVRYDSGLCVFCWNKLRSTQGPEPIAESVPELPAQAVLPAKASRPRRRRRRYPPQTVSAAS